MARVFTSCIVNAPIERVWGLLRDFGGWAAWHPSVTSCTIVNGLSGSSPGAIHRLALSDGGGMEERLLSHCDARATFSYTLLGDGAPMRDYVGQVFLHPVTSAGTSFLAWSADFQVDPADEVVVSQAIVAVFEAGFAGLGAALAAQGAR